MSLPILSQQGSLLAVALVSSWRLRQVWDKFFISCPRQTLTPEVGQPKGESEGRAPLQTVSSGVGNVAARHPAQVVASTVLGSFSQFKGKQYYLPLATWEEILGKSSFLKT